MSKPIEVFLLSPETGAEAVLDQALPAMTSIKGLANAIYRAEGRIVNPSFLNPDTFQRAMVFGDPRYHQEVLSAGLRRADIAMGILSHNNPHSAEFIKNALGFNMPTTLFQLERTFFPVLIEQVRIIPYEGLDDLSTKVRTELNRTRERLLHGR